MQKGFLLYVRFNRNWTEVYGPFRRMKPSDAADTILRRGRDHRAVLGVEGEAAVWWLAVPVDDGERLL